MNALDLAVLVAYLVAMAAMGVYFSRRNKNTEEYFVGGRRFGGLVVGLSLIGTSVSSITFLAMPGDTYRSAWLRYLFHVVMPLGALAGAYVFLPFFRRGRATTAYEYLEHRFGTSLRVYGSITFLIGQVFRVSLVLFLISKLIETLTGLDAVYCVMIGGLAVALYTILGGIDAVIWTDVIQTVVLVGGGLICLATIVWSLPGGVSQIIDVGLADGKLAFSELNDARQLQPASWGFSLSDKTALMLMLVGITHFLTEYATNQNVVQRYVASRSTREARKAILICAAGSVPIWTLFMFLGTSLYVYYGAFPHPEAAQILTGAGGREDAEILPLFIREQLPIGVRGLVIAAALAAAMSSLDSSINAVAAVGVTDIYRRLIVPGRDDRHYLRVAWLLSAVAGALMVGGAIVLLDAEKKTIQDTTMIVYGLIAGGLLGLYLLGFLTRRGNALAAWAGIAATTAFTLWTLVARLVPEGLPGWLQLPFDMYYTSMIGNLLMFVIGYAAGTVFTGDAAWQAKIAGWTMGGAARRGED